jgi:2-polyprenyl-3-methyl-5-hydroxy-6-metoxy-1,4-benzoquinol methylase
MNSNTNKEISFIERKFCPICDSQSSKIYIDFAEIPVLQCQNCNFIYSARIMDNETMIFYYKNTFSGDIHLHGQRVNATVNLIALENLLDFNSVNTFLDVGTGYGFLLKAIQSKHSTKTVGVELSQNEANYALNNLNVNVLPVLLKESNLPKSSFDVVSCFEVIEHIVQPISFVSELAEYVKPGGIMIIMTDNFTSSIATKLGAEFPKWIPHSHISHFTPQTLIRCIESVEGLKVEKQLSYTPW